MSRFDENNFKIGDKVLFTSMNDALDAMRDNLGAHIFRNKEVGVIVDSGNICSVKFPSLNRPFGIYFYRLKKVKIIKIHNHPLTNIFLPNKSNIESENKEKNKEQLNMPPNPPKLDIPNFSDTMFFPTHHYEFDDLICDTTE